MFAAGAPVGMDADPPLFGRDRELALLREHLDMARAGNGSVVLIGGEAGIGKTALAERVCRAALAQGFAVLRGQCYDLLDTAPYGPWADLVTAFSDAPVGLRALSLFADAAAPTAQGASSQASLFAQVRDGLVATTRERPLLLFLDDLQWADPASLDLLRFLARQLQSSSLILLVAYRADALMRRHPLFGLLPTLVHEARAVRLDLRRLDDEAIGALLRARYPLPTVDEERLVAYLAGRTEGNPFYIGELLRTLEEEGILRAQGGRCSLGELLRAPVPPFLQQVIEARLERLGEETRELLAVAAVIGQEIPFTVWEVVGEVEDEDLAEAVERAIEAHVLEQSQDGSAVRFTHALIREVLYEGLVAPRRRAWHRRAGEALSASMHADPDVVAFHFRQAGDPRAVDWLLRAGSRAQRTYAWITAVQRFEAALGLIGSEGDDRRRRSWLLALLAWLQRYSDPGKGVAYFSEALDIATEINEEVLIAYCRFFRGMVRCYGDDIRGGLVELEEGEAAIAAIPAAERERVPEIARILVAVLDEQNGRGLCALWLALVGRYAEAREMAKESLAQPPVYRGRVRGGSAYGDAFQAMGVVHTGLARPDEARAAFRRAREVYEAVEHPFQIGTTDIFEISEVLLRYRPDATDEFERATAAAALVLERVTGVSSVFSPALARLPRAFLHGDWHAARQIAEEHAAPGGIINRRLFALRFLAPLAHAQGDPDVAWRCVREVLPDGPDTAPGGAWYLLALSLQLIAAALSLETGSINEAQAWLEAHDRWLAWASGANGEAEGQLGWAALHVATGDYDRAATDASRAFELANKTRQPLVLAAAHRILARCAHARGDSDHATAHLREALALAEACRAPYERALTLVAWANAKVQADDPEWQAMLDEAREIAESLAAGLTRRVAEISERAESARKLAPAHPAGLSSREVDVLRLVAQGMTNAEAAERLFLSPRTIEQHLHSIYNKIGITSRAAATRFALEHRLG